MVLVLKKSRFRPTQEPEEEEAQNSRCVSELFEHFTLYVKGESS